MGNCLSGFQSTINVTSLIWILSEKNLSTRKFHTRKSSVLVQMSQFLPIVTLHINLNQNPPGTKIIIHQESQNLKQTWRKKVSNFPKMKRILTFTQYLERTVTASSPLTSHQNQKLIKRQRKNNWKAQSQIRRHYL